MNYQVAFQSKLTGEVIRIRNLTWHMAFMMVNDYLKWYNCYLYCNPVEELQIKSSVSQLT